MGSALGVPQEALPREALTLSRGAQKHASSDQGSPVDFVLGDGGVTKEGFNATRRDTTNVGEVPLCPYVIAYRGAHGGSLLLGTCPP